MLRVEALAATIGAPPVTFVVEAGTCVGLLGAHASRLLDVIAGLAPAAAGLVSRDVASDDTTIMRVRTSAMDPRLTAGEYLAAVAGARAATGQRLRRTVPDAMAALDLAPATPLTGDGVRRAVALAAALLPASPVVLLYDPLAGLTPRSREGAVRWIQALPTESTAVVAAFTAEGDARAVSHRVIRVEPGA